MVLGAREVEVGQVAPVVDDPLRVGVGEPDPRVGRVPKRRPVIGQVPELDHVSILDMSRCQTPVTRVQQECARHRHSALVRPQRRVPSKRCLDRRDSWNRVASTTSRRGATTDERSSTTRTKSTAGATSPCSSGPSRKHGWTVFAYCLMTNHFHLARPGAGPEPFRRNAGASGRVRALLELATWPERPPVPQPLQLCRRSSPTGTSREAARYVDLNPVRAKHRVPSRAMAVEQLPRARRLDHAPPFLATSALLELFGPTPAKARLAYRQLCPGRPCLQRTCPGVRHLKQKCNSRRIESRPTRG